MTSSWWSPGVSTHRPGVQSSLSPWRPGPQPQPLHAPRAISAQDRRAGREPRDRRRNSDLAATPHSAAGEIPEAPGRGRRGGAARAAVTFMRPRPRGSPAALSPGPSPLAAAAPTVLGWGDSRPLSHENDRRGSLSATLLR